MTTNAESTDRQKTVPPEECPITWFATLEAARAKSDFELAAQAVRELKRLGVLVRFTRGQKIRGDVVL